MSEEDQRNTLLDAVEALTKPQKVANWEMSHEHIWELCACKDDECGIYLCVWCEVERGGASETEPAKHMKRRTDIPLLDWLGESIRSNIGGNGGGKQARERTPMDLGAFTLYEDIDGRIRSWLDELGARPGKDVTPTQALRSWYPLWNAGQHSERLNGAYESILKGWKQAIHDKLDPPKRIEITAPCPICGLEWVNIGLKMDDGQDDPNDVETVRVLNAVEREKIEDSYVLCSACDRVWTGAHEMRVLRIAIDDAEEAAKMGGLTA